MLERWRAKRKHERVYRKNWQNAANLRHHGLYETSVEQAAKHLRGQIRQDEQRRRIAR